LQGVVGQPYDEMSHRPGPLVLLIVPALVTTAAASVAAAPLPSPGCEAATIEHGRRLERTIEVDGRRRAFILDVPESVKAGVPAPLLLDFHGFGHSGAGVWKVSAFKPLAERTAFITVYPEGLPVRLQIRGQEREGAGWEISSIDGNRDLALVRTLLDDLGRRYCIDRRRVYSTGFSNGAYFSQLLACALAERIAAVAPVSGGKLRVACVPSRPVPILIQHGRQDPLIPAEQARAAVEAWVAANGCDAGAKQPDGPACTRYDHCRDNAVVEYCEEDYVHTWPPQATDRVWQFLTRYQLP
jgi:polyhydroxybutyrate depolymerase